MPLESPGFVELLAAKPAETALHAILPLFLAGAQTVIALVHGAPLLVVAAFALVMVGFAVGAVRHSLASYRVESLETTLERS